jgi:voltage-gated potassium channel
MAERWQKAAGHAAGVAFASPMATLVRALGFVLVVFVLATEGFVWSGWSLADAAYMVTLTIFSVGYGEVHPIDTPYLRAITIATMVLGCTGMIALTGALVQAFAHYQLRNLLGMDRMQSQIERLADHIIICGFGRIGQQLAKELAAGRQGFIIVERSPGKIADAEAAGYLCLAADATDEASLKAAGIERARVLATVLPDDATNVFITLSARNLNPRLEIIARGELPSTESKLVHAGADKVVLPTHIGAERIAEMILYPTTARFLGEAPQVRDLKRGLHEFGLEIEAVTVSPDSTLAGETVGEAERRSGGAFFVVQIDRANGQSFLHPGEDVRIEAKDTVVLVVRGTRVSAGAAFGAPQKVRVGRGYRWNS